MGFYNFLLNIYLTNFKNITTFIAGITKIKRAKLEEKVFPFYI